MPYNLFLSSIRPEAVVLYVSTSSSFVTRLAGEVAIWSCANRTETGGASAPCKSRRLPAPRFW